MEYLHPQQLVALVVIMYLFVLLLLIFATLDTTITRKINGICSILSTRLRRFWNGGHYQSLQLGLKYLRLTKPMESKSANVPPKPSEHSLLSEDVLVRYIWPHRPNEILYSVGNYAYQSRQWKIKDYYSNIKVFEWWPLPEKETGIPYEQ